MAHCPICDETLSLYEFNSTPFGVLCDSCSSIVRNYPGYSKEEIKEVILNGNPADDSSDDAAFQNESEVTTCDSQHTKTAPVIIERRKPTPDEVAQVEKIFKKLDRSLTYSFVSR